MSLILSGTNGLSDVDGSAATPAIRGTDTNTGIFFPAADTIAFAEGGVEAMRLDSSGNMGLGVTPAAWGSPFKAFQFGPNGGSLNARTDSNQAVELALNWYYDGAANRYIYSNFATKYRQFAGGHEWYTSAFGTAGNTVTFTQAMTLDASGNLGIGTSSPGTRLDVVTVGGFCVGRFGNGNTQVGIGVSSDNSTFIEVPQAQPIRFLTNGTDRARIDSSGNLLVGTTNTSTSSGTGFKVTDTGQTVSVVTPISTNASLSTYILYSTGAAAYRFYVGAGGTVNATSTTITGISDQRLKENIRDLDDGLEKVMALQPRKFDWKEGKGANIKNARGFIAQEFETVFPDMIEEWLDPAPEGEEPYKAVNANLIPTLVKAIQEQQAIITQLQADVAALKEKA